MRFGVVILPDSPWSEARTRWQHAEELGFAHAWTYDHLAWRSLRDAPWFAAMPLLTAAAAATSRIRLGTLVASPNFRHPLPFAKELITLDDVSGGRAIAGVGSGGVGWDATMLGHAAWSMGERAQRFSEFVELLDLLLRRPEATWRGRYYTVDEARTYPGCVQRPRLPLAVAATGRRGMRLAAEHGDMWVTTGSGAPGPRDVTDGVRVVDEQVRRLDDACHEAGRDPAAVARLVLTGAELDAGLTSLEHFRDTAGRFQEIGVTDLVVHWPRPSPPYVADMATFERIFSSLS